MIGLDKTSLECARMNATTAYCVMYAGLRGQSFCSLMKSQMPVIGGVVDTVDTMMLGVAQAVGTMVAPIAAPIIGTVETIGNEIGTMVTGLLSGK